jgi:DNA-binding response OmpR family regulator
MNTKEISILLIDNVFKDIEHFIDIFKNENISILVAVSVKKAKAILHYIVPDLIVSEVDLKDGDGYDLLSFVRSRADYEKTPFLFLTRDTSMEKKVKALSQGADDYFTKPYMTEELIVRIRRIIKKVSVRRFDLDKKIFSSTSNLSIIEMFQLLEKTQKSGVFTVFTDHKAGIYHFDRGNVVRGKFGSLSGTEAVYKVLKEEDAIYEFEFKSIDCEPEIHESTTSVILDGLKLIDEAKGRKKKKKKEKRTDEVKHDVFCVGFKKNQIAHLFDESSFNMLSYEKPMDALAILKSLLPDIIVVKPDMPEMSGIKFLKRLKESTMTCHLPVIFLTMEKGSEEKVSALKEGVADYIHPPITKYEFDVKIKSVIKESTLSKKEYSNVLRGSLNNFTVLELIQGVQAIEKTCMITFYNGDDKCTLFFLKGDLANAKIQHSEGEEAVYKILMWCRGYFDIRFRDYPIPKAVKTSTFNLVLDGIYKTTQEEEEEVERIMKISSRKEREVSPKDMTAIGLYNFILETTELELTDRFSLNSVKTGGLKNFLYSEALDKLMLIDLNMVDNDGLEELLELKRPLKELIQNGLKLICFTSRPDIYSVQGVLNKYSWLANYDDTKKIKESLSDQIKIKTKVDFFIFNEIMDEMYYTAAFPEGFGSPPYKPILFGAGDVAVALYTKLNDGYLFLLPQPKSKESFLNFFLKKVIAKL